MKAIGHKKSRKNGKTSGSQAPGGRALTSVQSSSASPPTTVELCGVSVHFPFRPYKCQESYMEKVLEALHRGENALLESPTGTGKTLCLLCSTLAWQREQARLIPESQPTLGDTRTSSQEPQQPKQTRRVPTIIYASRTHSQLSQVVRELRNTRYRPKHAVLGSREQMCVHPKVKTANATSSEINHDCAKLAKERKCRFRNQLEGFTPPSNESGGTHYMQPVLDMEDLVEMGKTKKVCPFYYTRSLVADAELVLVPYNYLFDKDARESTLAEIRWEDAVVIFDEAHNLESFASESASFDLTSVHIAGCIGEITRAIGYIQAMPDLAERVRVDNLAKMKALLLGLEEYIVAQIPNVAKAYSGEYIFEIFQKGACLTHANHNLFVQEVRKVSDLIMDVRGGASGSTSKGTPQLENFVKCVKLVFGETTEARCLAKARTYRVHATPKEPGKNGGSARTISYWCFAPSLAMQELAGLNLRSIMVTSGTLSPLPSYSMELGLRFPHTLENPHIIKKKQCHVRVIGHGVSGKLLSSTYDRRETGEYLAELGNTLVSLSRVVPGGMLIFFTSYGVMETCVERWGGPASSRNKFKNKGSNNFFASKRRQQGNKYSFPYAPNYYASTNEPSTPWKRLLAQKAIVLEPRSTADLADAISEFRKFLEVPKSTGCVLMGVFRGKISEGIDFTDDMCRAVVITGIPFAPLFDPKVKLKREFLDGVRASHSIKPKGDGGFGDTNEFSNMTEKVPVTLSGAEWYSQQAHRAVNQAIGRVIRNKTDYGAVLLLDSRFGEERNQIGLSKWLRPHLQKDEGFGRAIGSLVGFYKEARKEAEAQKNAFQPSPNQGVLLKYEDEEEKEGLDDYMTNVAIIQKGSQNDKSGVRKDTAKESLLEGYVRPDQVLARIDLKAAVSAKNQRSGDVDNENRKNVAPTSSSLEALYKSSGASRSEKKSAASTPASLENSAWSGLTNAKSSSQDGYHKKARINRPEIAHSAPQKKKPSSIKEVSSLKDSKATAADFFQKAKALLSSEDFSTLRKMLVEMKSHGDKKDGRSYLRSARKLVVILIRYNVQTGTGRNVHSLVDLLYPLLPPLYRGEVEKVAIQMKFEKSTFYKLCQKTLPSDELLIVESSCLPLLARVGIARVASATYLRDAKPVVEILVKNEAKVSDKEECQSLLHTFFELIPTRYISSVQALADELKASKRILHVKNTEQSLRGEDGLQAALFRKTDLAPRPTINKENESSESNQEELEAKRAMEAALMQAEEIQRQRRSRINDSRQAETKTVLEHRNPYLKRPKTLSQTKVEPVSSSSSSTAAACKKLKTSSTKAAQQEKLAVRQSQEKQDPVESMIRQVASDSYAKHHSRDPASMLQKIKKNAPKDLVCTICSKPSKQPFMANCGHHACLGCWSQWIIKSKTCPV